MPCRGRPSQTGAGNPEQRLLPLQDDSISKKAIRTRTTASSHLEQRHRITSHWNTLLLPLDHIYYPRTHCGLSSRRASDPTTEFCHALQFHAKTAKLFPTDSWTKNLHPNLMNFYLMDAADYFSSSVYVSACSREAPSLDCVNIFDIIGRNGVSYWRFRVTGAARLQRMDGPLEVFLQSLVLLRGCYALFCRLLMDFLAYAIQEPGSGSRKTRRIAAKSC